MTERQRSHPILSTSTTRPALSMAARLGGLLTVVAVQSLYLPINRLLSGGIELKIPWDAYVPFWPIWVVPYLGAFAWWAVSVIWAAWKMDDRRYVAFIVATLVTMVAAYATYLLWPTYVTRPVPVGDSWAAGVVRWLYANDELYNAFPSGHVYSTLLIVFFWWDWQPRRRWLWALLGALVILSTLFTGQHHLLDPLGGALWAYGGYRVGWWVAKRWAGHEESIDES
jgi:membrane-associated phospholipid phosphatase